MNMNDNWIFEHDNDPKHRAAIVTNWLNRNGVKLLDRPFFSPDKNHIEHLWDEIERSLKKKRPRNQSEFKACLMEVLEEIELSVLKKSVDSIPNRLNEVIRVNGYPIRY